MAIQNLTVRQIMASFAYLAYCGEQITTPKPESEILDLINTAMPKIPPIAAPNATWSVVWGPVAYTVPGALYQDNLMFVVQNQKDTTQFAIAVRGTNFISDLDWLMEDFDILQMMPWPAQSGAQMSESTSIDLQVLLAMKGKCSFSAQATVLEFLQKQTAKPINLCVTGHSLGGCLAGTFALYLKDNQTSWDRSGKSLVCCVTFAGPTAGNATFATYSDGQFKGGGGFPGWDSSLGTNCDSVRCTYDVAPLAWTAAAVTIPNGGVFPPLLTIYGNNLNFMNMSFSSYTLFSSLVGFVCPKLVTTLTPLAYQQVVAGANELVGVFNAQFAPASDDLEDYLTAFVEQADYQHSDSYPSLLGVPQLNDPTIIVTNPSAARTTEAQRPRTRPKVAAAAPV